MTLVPVFALYVHVESVREVDVIGRSCAVDQYLFTPELSHTIKSDPNPEEVMVPSDEIPILNHPFPLNVTSKVINNGVVDVTEPTSLLLFVLVLVLVFPLVVPVLALFVEGGLGCLNMIVNSEFVPAVTTPAIATPPAFVPPPVFTPLLVPPLLIPLLLPPPLAPPPPLFIFLQHSKASFCIVQGFALQFVVAEVSIKPLLPLFKQKLAGSRMDEQLAPLGGFGFGGVPAVLDSHSSCQNSKW